LSVTQFIDFSYNCYMQHDFEKSIGYAKEAIRLDPSNAIAYNNLGSAYNAAGMFEQAIEALNKALELDPTNQLAKNNLLDATKKRDKNR
jgi:protein O-mannosyl-transferase